MSWNPPDLLSGTVFTLRRRETINFSVSLDDRNRPVWSWHCDAMSPMKTIERKIESLLASSPQRPIPYFPSTSSEWISNAHVTMFEDERIQREVNATLGRQDHFYEDLFEFRSMNPDMVSALPESVGRTYLERTEPLQDTVNALEELEQITGHPHKYGANETLRKVESR
ncbi:hypothetical protein HDU76_000886 [Blyttiomyces sp. JEL0837]|nr:hypothetical protein HDU76_000886 [Blyttiomyces sp. JEL0837]